jgi:dUTPase
MKKVTTFVIKSRCSPYMKNALTYKNKWGTINGDFKQIFNYMIGIRHND